MIFIPTLIKYNPRLVCSDLISRGIDISHVRHVVSYDVPIDMRKYVHRVGRTARAGRDGDAWTLVEEHEVCLFCFFRRVAHTWFCLCFKARYFKDMLKQADHLTRVKRLRFGKKDFTPFMHQYEVCLFIYLFGRVLVPCIYHTFF